jgi:hypothetical protein
MVVVIVMVMTTRVRCTKYACRTVQQQVQLLPNGRGNQHGGPADKKCSSNTSINTISISKSPQSVQLVTHSGLAADPAVGACAARSYIVGSSCCKPVTAHVARPVWLSAV